MTEMRNPYCRCAYCRTRGLMGPVLLITIGVLFLLQVTAPGWNFGQTWPVILIVIGLVKVVERMASRRGHQELPPLPGGPLTQP